MSYATSFNAVTPAGPMTLVMPPEPVLRLPVASYLQLGEAGVLDVAETELLDGLLAAKMAKSPWHSWVVRWLRGKLSQLLGSAWLVDSELSIRLDTSLPEPDLVVVRGPAEQYKMRYPTGGDAVLVIEVSDSTLARDQTWKRPIYAAAGIPTYWIVNLVDRVLEVYSRPSSGDKADYAPAVIITPDATAPLVIDGVELARVELHEILSPRE